MRHLTPLIPLLAAELNVKQVEFASSGDALVTLEAKPNFRALGKKFGKKTPLGGAGRCGVHERTARASSCAGEPLVVTVEGNRTSSAPDDLTIVRRASGASGGAGGRRVLRGDRSGDHARSCARRACPRDRSAGYNVCERSRDSRSATGSC